MKIFDLVGGLLILSGENFLLVSQAGLALLSERASDVEALTAYALAHGSGCDDLIPITFIK